MGAASNCKGTDIKCICGDTAFISSITSCVKGACDSSDEQSISPKYPLERIQILIVIYKKQRPSSLPSIFARMPVLKSRKALLTRSPNRQNPLQATTPPSLPTPTLPPPRTKSPLLPKPLLPYPPLRLQSHLVPLERLVFLGWD
jgi:hypothetical protein